MLYHKKLHKSGDYLGLFAFELIIFCLHIKFERLGEIKAVGVSVHRSVLFVILMFF